MSFFDWRVLLYINAIIGLENSFSFILWNETFYFVDSNNFLKETNRFKNFKKKKIKQFNRIGVCTLTNFPKNLPKKRKKNRKINCYKLFFFFSNLFSYVSLFKIQVYVNLSTFSFSNYCIIYIRSYNNLSQKQNYNTIIILPTIDSYFQDTNRWHNCAIKKWKSLPDTALFTFRNAFVENYFVGLFAQTDSIIFSTANCYTWRASSSANGPRVVCNSHFQTPRNSKPYEKCRRLQTWFAFVQITRQLSIVSTYYYEGFFVRETR